MTEQRDFEYKSVEDTKILGAGFVSPPSNGAVPKWNDTLRLWEEAFIAAGPINLKGDIDCSTNPNYPPAVTGDAWVVTVAGKIGGAAGKVVNIGDLVVAKADNPGGDEATVGADWFVLESNRDQATETRLGVARLATQAETYTGIDDLTIVTPLKLRTAYPQRFSGVGPPNGVVNGQTNDTYVDLSAMISYMYRGVAPGNNSWWVV